MIKRMPTNCGDPTCSSCVVAGDFAFLAHHAGGFEKQDAVYQIRAAFANMQKTLRSVGAELKDVVQINLYLKDLADFRQVADAFDEFFPKEGAPARMTTTTQFIDSRCLCMLDGVAYLGESQVR